MSCETILVTGGAGYVGSHVIVELIGAGYATVILDNRKEAIQECLSGVKLITGVSPPAYSVDLLDKEEIHKVFTQHKIDCVLHLAGLKAVRESHSQPLQYYNVNVMGSMNLFEVMQEVGVYNIVFSSSSKVYGVPQYLPLDEKHPTGQCTNPYGRTKYMVEQILSDICSANKNWKVTVLRYFNPSGAHSSGNIGESRDSPPKNLMPCICHAAQGKMKTLKVFGSDYETNDGTAVKDYTHIMDLARGHIAAIQHLQEGDRYKVYNMGAGRTYSILEMVKIFEDLSGRKIPVEMCDRKPGELGEVSSDSSKAFTELSWKAEKSLLNMCEDMWKWVCSDVANGQSDTTRVYSDVANGQSDTITRTESLVNCDNVLNSDIDSGTSPVKKTKISANNSDLSS